MALTVKWLSGKLEPNYTYAVTYAIGNCTDHCAQMQVIQVFYGRGGPDLPDDVETWTLELDGQQFRSFVDGSPTSPAVVMHNREPGHKVRPYYYGPVNLRSNVSGCHVTIYDQPTAVQQYAEAYFETAVVCVDYDHSGVDRIVRVFQPNSTD